jgi:uncharacterized protein with HEPN domain
MRDTSVVIEEMLQAIADARQGCAGKSFDQFAVSRLERLAVERAIEIVSEAARHLTAELTARHPTIPWPKIRAVGNILRHEYHRVAPKIVWEVVQNELDSLEVVLTAERQVP